MSAGSTSRPHPLDGFTAIPDDSRLPKGKPARHGAAGCRSKKHRIGNRRVDQCIVNMACHPIGRLRHIALPVALVCLLHCPPSWAQNVPAPDRTGFRVGLELGAASVERKIFDTGIDDTTFYMGFTGGYWLVAHVLAGLELNGWLLQASNLNDPTVGEGISRVFVFAKVYPGRDNGWFLKAAGGYVSHWNRRPGEPDSVSGDGYELGGGYDLDFGRPGNSWLVTPFATYSAGTIGIEEHEALTVGVGFSYQF